MTAQDGFTEYLELQGDSDLITKAELLRFVREHGGRLSDRTLTYWTTEGLIPPAARIGGRRGVYPRLVADLALWIVRMRKRAFSLDAIRELLPLWKLLYRQACDGCVDLMEIELVARNHITADEANYAVPFVVQELAAGLCEECFATVQWVLKDGAVVTPGSTSEPLVLSFILAELNAETGQGRPVAWTQLAFPGMGAPSGHDPATIILGLPVGIDVEADDAAPTPKDHEHQREEVHA